MKERSSIMWSLLPFRVHVEKLYSGYKACNIIFTIVILVNSTSQNLASYPRSSFEFASLKSDNAFQRTAAGCSFPSEWHGSWFHLGFPKPLNISKDFIDSKGTCTHSNGARFIVGERSSDGRKWSCFKCMIIHQKHPNVLQYKESYCDSDFSGDISSLCDRIESDSVLFFMFRQQKNNTLDYKCPFDGVHTFSYSTRHGNAKCSQPPSHIDSCTDKTKMVFKFQACPDVPGSESSDEVLECIAGWKEGSSSYLIGRTTPLQRYHSPISVHKDVAIGLMPHPLDKNIQTTGLQQHQDSKYQCFRYEMHMEDGRIVTKMSQSNKGSCEGLWSAVEGDRTYTLKKVDTAIEECGLPHWLVSRTTWSNMDSSLTIKTIKGSTRGINMVVNNNYHNRSHSMNQYWKGRKPTRKERTEKGKWKKLFNDNRRQFNTKTRTQQAEVESQITCHTILKSDVLNTKYPSNVKLIAYQKLGCTSGYVCLEMKLLHSNIIHLKVGNQSRLSDEACTSHFFSSSDEGGHLLIADGSNEDCPFIGRYEETNIVSTATNSHLPDWDQNTNIPGRPSKGCIEWIQSGCPLGSNMLINSCTAYKKKALDINQRRNQERKGQKRVSIRNQQMIDVTCVGKWSHSSTHYTENVNKRSTTKTNYVKPNTFSLPTEREDYDNLDRDTVPNTNQITNLIVRRRNGLSYCIQYRDKKDPGSYPKSKKVSNATIQQLMYHQNILEIRISSKGCPDPTLFISGRAPAQKKQKSKNIMLSSTFKYKGPCQAALTDAASVSKASSSRLSLNLKQTFNVITVVTIPGLFHIFSTRMLYYK